MGVKIYTSEPVINWSGGTFNGGTFGSKDLASSVYWWGGDFYGDTFISDYSLCPSVPYGYSAFYNGTFHNGTFNGTLWGGVWITGTFNGCNMTSILTNTAVITPTPVIIRRYGELPLKVNNKNKSTL